MTQSAVARAIGAALALALVEHRSVTAEVLLTTARRRVDEALSANNGNVAQAADALGVSKRALYVWIQSDPWVAERKAHHAQS